jgi:hypothetical protein
MFWTGVALSPLAALLVLMSSGTQALRMAALLAIAAVVLVGLSIMLRPDASQVRAELEDSLFGEIDGLRAAVRSDITSAARATHKSLSDKLQDMYEHVEALRGQLETMRREYESGQAKAAAAQTGRATPVPPSSPRHMGTAMVGGGVVRHTETVQVTTRSTIVDPPGSDDRGRVYGRRAAREERPREESWTEQRLRDRLRDTGSHLFGDPGRFTSGYPATGGGQAAHSAPGEGRDDFARRARTYGRHQSEDDDAARDPRWSDMRAGDRWAAVRSDDHGRELRMGERRAAMHSDDSGTELRVEDRWAAVRREAESYGYQSGETRQERRERETQGWSGGRHTGSQPAVPQPRMRELPAEAPSEGYGPSWTRDWREDTGGGGHRERVDRWEREEMPARPVSGARRRLDFELTDDRWR